MAVSMCKEDRRGDSRVYFLMSTYTRLGYDLNSVLYSNKFLERKKVFDTTNINRN